MMQSLLVADMVHTYATTLLLASKARYLNIIYAPGYISLIFIQ